jgi:hypothetical protein
MIALLLALSVPLEPNPVDVQWLAWLDERFNQVVESTTMIPYTGPHTNVYYDHGPWPMWRTEPPLEQPRDMLAEPLPEGTRWVMIEGGKTNDIPPWMTNGFLRSSNVFAEITVNDLKITNSVFEWTPNDTISGTMFIDGPTWRRWTNELAEVRAQVDASHRKIHEVTQLMLSIRDLMDQRKTLDKYWDTTLKTMNETEWFFRAAMASAVIGLVLMVSSFVLRRK